MPDGSCRPTGFLIGIIAIGVFLLPGAGADLKSVSGKTKKPQH